MAIKDIPFSIYKFSIKVNIDDDKLNNLIANELKIENEAMKVILNFNNEMKK